jgi:hypothetical protein
LKWRFFTSITVSFNAYHTLWITSFYFYAGYYPGVIDITINGEKQPFSITLTMLYPKDPKNNHNSDVGWLQVDDFYKRVETFVFNGTEFVGDYSIFLDI